MRRLRLGFPAGERKLSVTRQLSRLDAGEPWCYLPSFELYLRVAYQFIANTDRDSLCSWKVVRRLRYVRPKQLAVTPVASNSWQYA